MASKANSATKPNEPKCLVKLNFQDLKATKGRGKAGMNFHNVSLNGHPLNFLLLPLGEYTTVPWRPSVDQGEGTDNRVNIQFNITEYQRTILENIEEAIREQ